MIEERTNLNRQDIQIYTKKLEELTLLIEEKQKLYNKKIAEKEYLQQEIKNKINELNEKGYKVSSIEDTFKLRDELKSNIDELFNLLQMKLNQQ